MILGSGAGIIYNPILPAYLKLSKLAKQLGGQFWYPGISEFEDSYESSDWVIDDPAEVDDTIGYWGDAATYNEPENLIRNSDPLTGGGAGTHPTYWTGMAGTSNGITRSIVGVGTDADGDYIEQYFTGTATTSANAAIATFNGTAASAGHAAAKVGDFFTASWGVKLV